jgi:hypothetical protein
MQPDPFQALILAANAELAASERVVEHLREAPSVLASLDLDAVSRWTSVQVGLTQAVERSRQARRDAAARCGGDALTAAPESVLPALRQIRDGGRRIRDDWSRAFARANAVAEELSRFSYTLCADLATAPADTYDALGRSALSRQSPLRAAC